MPTTQAQLVAALESTRAIVPGYNNWLLFSATVEAGADERWARSWDRMRVDYALRQHEQWYKGDGAYGDGPEFHWDYYNSFVIHPMLMDVLAACGDESPAWKEIGDASRAARARATPRCRSGSIAPDGSFPPIGRSIAYRCGAFHLLAQTALRRALPEGVSPAQVRGALTAVIRRTLEAPGHVRRERLAAHRLLRPPARHRRNLHFDRQPVSVRRRACCRSACRRPTSSGPRRRSPGPPPAHGRARRFPIDHALGS